MTNYEAWVAVRAFLHHIILFSASRRVSDPRRRKFTPTLVEAVGIIDAALGYADGVSGRGFSRLDAWRVCRRVTMRCAGRGITIQFRQRSFALGLRDAMDILDSLFGFEVGERPYECRYHGRLSRQELVFGFIEGFFIEQCPHCRREAFPILC